MTTTHKTSRASRAAESETLLAAATENVKLRPDPYKSGWGTCPDALIHPSREEEDPVRTLLTLAGMGQALLALGDVLDDRLADVADAITGVQDQIGELADAARPARRWWGRGRGAARPAIDAADMEFVRQALADAAAYRPGVRSIRTSGLAVRDDHWLADRYEALRERLGGGAA